MKLLIKDILAVKPDSQGRPYSEICTICIQGSKIISAEGVPEGFSADETIDGRGRLITPGMVNSHSHAYMTMLRNRADDTDFDTWLFKKIMPAEDRLTPEDAYWSAMLGCAEMLTFGITCFLDMHMFPDITVKAALDCGMRAVISRGLSGGVSDAAGGKRRLKEALDEYCRWKDTAPEQIKFMLAPHAITTCDEGYMREIAAAARDLNLGIHTHMSEGRNEASLCIEKYGCTPAQLYERTGLLSCKAVAAHCIHLTDADIDILSRHQVSVSLNPASNLKLANGIAPVPAMLSKGINCCLGTDSTASNNSLSILREMSLTSLIHKGISADPCGVTAGDTFKMATVNGARALGFEGICGEIKPGMQADLAIFDISTPELTPLSDPISALSYANSGMKAETVISAGKIIMHKGEFKTLDIDRIVSEVNQRAERNNKE